MHDVRMRSVVVLLGAALVLPGACAPSGSAEREGVGSSTPPVADTGPSPTPSTPPSPVVTDDPDDVVCADGDDQMLWLEDADLRHAAFAGGSDHRTWLRTASGRFGEGAGLTVGVRSGNLYSAPVPTGLVEPLTGEPPADVLTAFVGGRLRACASRGVLEPLDALWEERGWADRLPASVIDLATVDGHRAFAPTTVQWNPVFYRTDLLDALGLAPPATWDELLAICDAFREDGRAAFTSAGAWSPPTARTFTILDLRLNGAAFHDRLLWGQESWHDPRVADVLDHWEEMIDRGCFVDDPAANTFRDAVDDLASGRAAMWNIGEWLHEFLDPEVHDRLDFFAFPELDPDVPRAEIALVQGVAVRAGAGPEATALAAFLTSDDVLRDEYEALQRVVVDPGVDLPYHGVRARAHAFLEEATDLVELLEFSTEPVHASTVLTGLVRFSRDPDDRAEVLEDLEASRLERFSRDRGETGGS